MGQRHIHELERGNEEIVDDLFLWFLPTSDWDDFIKMEGLELGQRVSVLLAKCRENT